MKLPNILLIILFVALLSLNAGAQANEGAVLKAETSTSASRSGAKQTKVDLPSKSKVVSSPTPAPTAPPLASVPESKPQELPFKLNERQQLATEAPSAGGMLLRTFGALLLIVGLIAAAGWALRHFGVINFGKQHSDAAGLKVLDTVQLGDRRTLTLVKFGERTLLIGSTPQGLSLLAEQAEELELPQGDYMPTVRTVTDLLDVNAAPPFEQELTRASLINTNWSDRSVQ